MRRILGVDYGGKIAYRIENGAVTIDNAEAEHMDPTLRAFLDLLARDIAQGRILRILPPGVIAAMTRARKQAGAIDLSQPLEGDVAL